MRVTAAIASVAVARAARPHGFLVLAIGYLVAGLRAPAGIYTPHTISTSLPRSFTLAMGRAESPSEQNKDVFKMPLLGGKTPMWERGSGRGSPELEDAARQGGNLSREKDANASLTPFPPAPRF